MKKILIIDDDSEVRFNLQIYLEDEGFECMATDSAEHAQILLSQKQYDIAIVDLRLPGINGEEFIIKTASFYPNLKFLIHTGSIDYTISQQLQQPGFNKVGLLHKPVENMNEFVGIMKKLFYEDN